MMEAAAGTQCFDKAWEHPSNGGLGLTKGHAVKLCSGGSSGKTIQCFDKAWEHPSNGGLGLTMGQAVKLCSGG